MESTNASIIRKCSDVHRSVTYSVVKTLCCLTNTDSREVFLSPPANLYYPEAFLKMGWSQANLRMTQPFLPLLAYQLLTPPF